MDIAPDDLIRGAMALKDEATMLDGTLVTATNPMGFGFKGLRDRSESLKRCAAFLERHAGVSAPVAQAVRA